MLTCSRGPQKVAVYSITCTQNECAFPKYRFFPVHFKTFKFVVDKRSITPLQALLGPVSFCMCLMEQVASLRRPHILCHMFTWSTKGSSLFHHMHSKWVSCPLYWFFPVHFKTKVCCWSKKYHSLICKHFRAPFHKTWNQFQLEIIDISYWYPGWWLVVSRLLSFCYWFHVLWNGGPDLQEISSADGEWHQDTLKALHFQTPSI